MDKDVALGSDHSGKYLGKVSVTLYKSADTGTYYMGMLSSESENALTVMQWLLRNPEERKEEMTVKKTGSPEERHAAWERAVADATKRKNGAELRVADLEKAHKRSRIALMVSVLALLGFSALSIWGLLIPMATGMTVSFVFAGSLLAGNSKAMEIYRIQKGILYEQSARLDSLYTVTPENFYGE